MKGKERRFEENVHYTPPSLRSATLCCRLLNGLGCRIHRRNGRDAEWTARPAPASSEETKQRDRRLRGKKDRDGANVATTPSRPFQPSLIRGRLGELACLHALCFPHFVFCGDRGSRSSHPLSKKHGGFIQNAKKKRGKNGAAAMGWVVLKFAYTDSRLFRQKRKKTKDSIAWNK